MTHEYGHVIGLDHSEFNTALMWPTENDNISAPAQDDCNGFQEIYNWPSKPASPSPSHTATGVSISSALSWANGGGATSYDVYFGTDSSPDSSEFKGNQSGLTYNPGTLAYSTTYYWRIDAKNSHGTATGDVWRFTTAAAPTQPPQKPVSPSPANAATGISISSAVSWANGGGATSYDVYFGTTSTPGSGQYKGNQAGLTYNPGTLAYSTTYYWRIDARNASGATAGDVWRFTTAAAPTQPPQKAVSPSPANAASGVSISSALSWANGGGATSYDVYFGTTSTPGAGQYKGNQAGLTYNPGTLAYSTTYYWRIDARNAGGTAAGYVWWFKTGALPPSITTTSPLPPGTVATAYGLSLQATGGTAPYTWSLSSGSLPPGLTLVPGSGAITGIPTLANSYSFGVQVRDAENLIAQKNFSLTVRAPNSAKPSILPWLMLILEE